MNTRQYTCLQWTVKTDFWGKDEVEFRSNTEAEFKCKRDGIQS